MTSDSTDQRAGRIAGRTRLFFWSSLVGVVAVSLFAFTITIGSGRISGPGVALSLSAGALVWVARLLFQAARALVESGETAMALEEKAASGRRRKELEREYYNLKRALKELELDHAMAKVSAEDYDDIRTRYRERAVRILRQLDQDQGAAYYRSQIEADLGARRQALAQAPSLVENTIVGQCVKCATRNDSDAIFCKSCGQRLKAP